MFRVFHAFCVIFSDGFLKLLRMLDRNVSGAPFSPWTMAHRGMSATALNDRQSAGIRCRGFLGKPTVQMLG